jgi:hypothetical protein
VSILIVVIKSGCVKPLVNGENALIPGSPFDPGAPAGIPKLKVAALEVPILVTVGVDPEGKGVTSPTVIVAAGPCGPCGPLGIVEELQLQLPEHEHIFI